MYRLLLSNICVAIIFIAATGFTVSASPRFSRHIEGTVVSNPDAREFQPDANAVISGQGGRQASADGRYVVFESRAANLVSDDTNGFNDVFVRDTILGTTKRVSLTSDGRQSNGFSGAPSISDDGRYVAFRATLNKSSRDMRC